MFRTLLLASGLALAASAPTTNGQGCAALTGQTLTIDTAWDLNQNNAVSYPCSAGYAKNFAANENLLHDVRAAIKKAGELLGAEDCQKKCDIDNGSYTKATKVVGSGDLKDVLPEEFCGEHGFLRNAAASGFTSENPCVCDSANGYYAGCRHCFTEGVEFTLKYCYDLEEEDCSQKETLFEKFLCLFAQFKRSRLIN
jgi:hypothetical protein